MSAARRGTAAATAPTLRELLDDGAVHVMDGAMGTLLYARGVFVNVCYDELAVTEPDLVRDVHAAYVKAGAEIVETNTFGANPVKLSGHGLEDRTEELNAASARLAREATAGAASVIGAVGPLGIRLEPFGPTAREEARAYFRRQVEGLVEGGVDGFVLETFSDLSELEEAFRAVREVTDLPVICQMTVGEDASTAYGTAPEAIAGAATEWGADAVGLNCSVGPAVLLDAIERMARVTDLPLSVQPNAGLPRAVRDRKIYLASPEYMARYARRLIEAGARFVGGCCGTTPEHVEQIRDTVASLQPRTARVVVGDAVPLGERTREEVPLGERSAWGRKLAAGERVTTVELLPPRGWDPEELVRAARRMAASGADAVNLVDSARGHSRMGVIPAGLILLRELELEPVIHYTCRDRNMMSMLSDLLGAAAAGIRNLLLVTGDPPVSGPYPDATAVFDIDSIGLTNVVKRLNQGIDPGGNAIGAPTEFVIGVAANQSAVDGERELERLYWKVDAGAEFCVTQTVFDADELRGFLRRAEEREVRIPTVASLWPLTSLRNAEFLANEVPGVDVPDAVLERMRRAQDRGAAAAADEGVAIALEVLQELGDEVEGIMVSATDGKLDGAERLLEAARG